MIIFSLLNSVKQEGNDPCARASLSAAAKFNARSPRHFLSLAQLKRKATIFLVSRTDHTYIVHCASLPRDSSQR